MRVVEIGNLAGVDGVDCGILIEASPNELSRIKENLLYKDVNVICVENENKKER